MSAVDRYGVRIEREMCHEDEDERIREERAKSLEMAIRLKRGWSVDRVARYYRVHRTTVWRRVRAIPEEATRLVG